MLQEADKGGPAARVRRPAEDLEVQAVDQDAQGFRGAGNGVGRRLGSDRTGIEGVDPAAGVVGVAEIAQPLQEVEVEGLDEGRVAGQGVGLEGADVLSAGVRTPTVRARETAFVGGHRGGHPLVDGRAPCQKRLGWEDGRSGRVADGRAAVGRVRCEQRVERGGDGAGLGGGSDKAGVAAAGAGDANQVAAVIGERAGGVIGVPPGGREVLGDDSVLDGEGRTRRALPEDAAAAGGGVGVDGVIQEHQAAGEGGRRVDAAAVGAGVVQGAVAGDGDVGDGRAAGPGAGRLDLQATAAHDGRIAGEGAGRDGQGRAVGEQAAAAAAAGVVLDQGVADGRARAALLDGAAVADGRVIDEDAVGDDQRPDGVFIGKAATHSCGEVVLDRAAGDGDDAVAGVADAAAAGGDSGGQGLVVADDGPGHHHRGSNEHGAHLNRVDVNARTLVEVGVAGDHRAAIDDDRAQAIGIDAAARVAGVVVADRAVGDGQRPGAVDRVLHDHAAAVGGRVVVGDDHVEQRQVGVALVADAAAGSVGAVWVSRVGHGAVLDGEALHADQELGGGVAGGAGVDVEDPVELVAIDDDGAAAGVLDEQRAVGGAGRVGNDVEVAGRIVVLAGAGKSDLVGAGDGQVDGVIAQRGVGCLDGGAQGDDADGRYEQVGGAVDVEDRRHTALFERFQVGDGPALAGRCRVLPPTGPALEPLARVREHGATPLGQSGVE